jgi:ABC-type sugar transport system ATPase subunit
MYTLANVTKDYQKGCGTVHALAGVDLVLEDRAWLAIQGPTGHGKSTSCRYCPVPSLLTPLPHRFSVMFRQL